jgi:hypothetical protein
MLGQRPQHYAALTPVNCQVSPEPQGGGTPVASRPTFGCLAVIGLMELIKELLIGRNSKSLTTKWRLMAVAANSSLHFLSFLFSLVGS